jgi:hypothetical protein
MKQTIAIWVIILFIMAGCGGNKQTGIGDALITVDVTTKYPMKTLVLQDFMDVEYIALETNDEFVCQGHLQDVGKKFIIVINRTGDGDIFIFDRSGKAIKKINRKGQGGEEYTGIVWIALDEDKGELFVNDYFARKILVYDLEGNFKRIFQHKEGYKYGEMYSFDQEHLICHDVLNENSGSLSLVNQGQSFMIISKQDGRVTKEIHIPFKEKKSAVIRFLDEASGMSYAYAPSTLHPLIPYFDNWVLVEISADTVYNYSPEHQIAPIIARKPSVQSMDPEVFLFLSLLTDRYYFMETVKKEMGFPDGEDLLYDRKENAIFRYVVYNDDYLYNEKAFLKSRPINKEIPSRQILEAHELVEAYEKGKLKGRLKEIAAELDEESNPVLMLIKHKK